MKRNITRVNATCSFLRTKERSCGNFNCYVCNASQLSFLNSVDATSESGRLGRLINHSRKQYNCIMRLFHTEDGMPRLIALASRNIEQDEEILYDYGDRTKTSLASFSWLSS